MRRTIVSLLACIALAAVGSGARASTGACAGSAPGGEWRSYGHDLSNSRTQPDEHAIGTLQAAQLQQAWIFNTASQAGSGSIQSTPTVADGCVFFATDFGGDVFALN